MESKKIPKELKSKDLFMVTLLGIVFDTKTRKILIGKRKNDENVKKLTWGFPGGRPHKGEELEVAIKREIKLKTGLNVENLGQIFSRIIPENKDILLMYYLCEKTGGKEKAGNKFTEIKWIKPTEIKKYFKTSTHPQLREYLNNLK